MAGQHSRLGASGAGGWMRCSGRPHAEAGLPDRVTSWAAEGTAFHEVVELCLLFGLDPEDFRGLQVEADGLKIPVDDEMIGAMRFGLERVRELAEGDEVYLFIETRVDLSGIYDQPDEFGTLDVGIINIRKREITIWDWKYGKGIPVDPVENEQLRVYGLGFWDNIAWKFFDSPDDITVRIHIEQPRVAGGGGEWFTTMRELLAWVPELQAGAAATVPADAPRTPGEKQCRMCRRRKTREGCYAYNAMVADLLGSDFDEMDVLIEMDAGLPLPHPDELTTERRAWICLHADMIRKWLDLIHGHTLAEALRDEGVPFVKPVAGREGKRTYLGGEDVEKKVSALLVEALGPEEAFDRKPISPTQAEKKLSPELYAELRKFVHRSPAKPSLAPLSAKAPRIASLEDDFSEEDVELGED